MNKEETKCHELTETIAAVLDNDHLQQLFVSTQKNNIELCMIYALKRWVYSFLRDACTH